MKPNKSSRGLSALLTAWVLTFFAIQTYADQPATTQAADSLSTKPAVIEIPGREPRRNADGQLARIRLGVIVSHFSATGPNITGRAGFGWASKAFRDGLLDNEFDCYPIIDPGTAKLDDVPDFITKNFPNRKPIDCSDTAAMAEVDVIAAPFVLKVSPEMLQAVESAVHDRGTGLFIRAWFGNDSPGYTEPLLALHGLSSGQWGWNAKDQDCKVLLEHPILQGTALHVGDALKMEPNGAYGVSHAIPIIGVDMQTISPVGPNTVPNKPEFQFAPLAVSGHGKGRIVTFSVLGHNNDTRTRNAIHTITVRSVKWLAGQLEENAKDGGL